MYLHLRQLQGRGAKGVGGSVVEQVLAIFEVQGSSLSIQEMVDEDNAS